MGLMVTVRSTATGKRQNGKTDLERLSGDGCSFPLGSGLGFGSVMDD